MTFEEWQNDKELKMFPCEVCKNFRDELHNPKLCETCAENEFCSFDFDEERIKDITLEDFRKTIFKGCEQWED